MHIRLIAPYIAPGAAEPVAALTAFFLRRGDDVRLFTVDAADELPPALAQLVCTRVADAAELARSLAITFPEICGPDVMKHQTNWHAERQADFAEYLVRMGRDASDVNGEWPIRGIA